MDKDLSTTDRQSLIDSITGHRIPVDLLYLYQRNAQYLKDSAPVYNSSALNLTSQRYEWISLNQQSDEALRSILAALNLISGQTSNVELEFREKFGFYGSYIVESDIASNDLLALPTTLPSGTKVRYREYQDFIKLHKLD